MQQNFKTVLPACVSNLILIMVVYLVCKGDIMFYRQGPEIMIYQESSVISACHDFKHFSATNHLTFKKTFLYIVTNAMH